MGKSSGSNTTTTTSSPPAAYTAAYSDLVSRAQSVANQPYTPYTGQLVAGLSPDTSSAITAVQNAQGIQNPYYNAAAQYMNSATTPLWSNTQQWSPQAIQSYMNPYTSSVVGATQAEFNNQNQQQQNQLAGNAASQGAFGGDRQAVAQAVLAGQQQLTQAPTIAGLYSTGYSQAQQEFNAQQAAQLGANEAQAWLSSQAGAGMESLGTQALSSALTGASALSSMGTLEQQQAQSLLNVPYEQYVAGQAYPYQQTSWLSNIVQGLGSSAGGTSSTTSPSASTASQVLGAGLSTAGILNMTGAFGNTGSSSSGSGSGWLSSLFSGSGSGTTSGISSSVDAALANAASSVVSGGARGGAVSHLASGGIPDVSGGFMSSASSSPTSAISLPSGNTSVPDVSVGFVPKSTASTSGTTPLIQRNYGSTSTTSGGGSSGLSLGNVISAAGLVAALANRGGAVDAMRPHNDNWEGGWQEPHRAAGGSTSSSPQVYYTPGAYAGSPAVPQLTTGPNVAAVGNLGGSTTAIPSSAGAQGLGAVSSNPLVQSYLAQQLSGAYSRPQTTSTTTATPTPAAAMTPSVTVTTVPESASGSLESGGGGGTGGGSAEMGGGANSSADSGGTNAGGAESGGGGGGANAGRRGGAVRHLQAGGDAGGNDYDLPGMQPSDTDQQGLPPSALMGSGTNNPYALAAGAERTVPEMGSGEATATADQYRVLPRERLPSERQVAVPPDNGPSLMPTTTQPSGGMAPPTTSGETPPARQEPPGRKTDWGKMLLLVGANMMAGRSPNALTNIGAGLAAGMKQYEGEENVQDRIDLAARRLSDNASATQTRLRQGQETIEQRGQHYTADEAIRQRAQDIQQQRANQGQQRLTDQQATAQARLDVLRQNAETARQRAATGEQRASTYQQSVEERVRRDVATEAQRQTDSLNRQLAAANAQSDRARQFAAQGDRTQLNGALNWMRQNTVRDISGKILKQPTLDEAMDAVGAVMPNRTQQQQTAPAPTGNRPPLSGIFGG